MGNREGKCLAELGYSLQESRFSIFLGKDVLLGLGMRFSLSLALEEYHACQLKPWKRLTNNLVLFHHDGDCFFLIDGRLSFLYPMRHRQQALS